MVTDLYADDLFGASTEPAAAGIVAARFGISPFSILDARGGEWQERKRAWLALGIKSEMGRSDKPTTASHHLTDILGRKANTRVDPRAYGIHDWMQTRATRRDDTPGLDGLESFKGDGTSIFDPVLCEMAYRWFCPAGGQVVDPFAGGSVRGVVAKATGRRYWGCELRAEQVAANIAQAEEIFPGFDLHSDELPGLEPPDLEWHCGDSAVQIAAAAPRADLVFSCPPYGDLEVYSDDPVDLSAMPWDAFIGAYRTIIRDSIERLRPDRFACFVVGDFRRDDGYFHNLVGVTVDAFQDAGARLYNEAILVTPVGTAAMRVTKQFTTSRKLAKTHQNVLVFCKGDPRAATAACGPA